MNRKRRLLLVEDEDAIRAGLIDVFVYHGFDVEAVADGREGLERALAGRFDLILLDVMLPSLNGFDICDAIRQADREQPIIMLTAKVSDDDIVNGLKLGADDYIGKPFGVQELVLRVEAVLRRTRGAADLPRHIELGGGLVVDSENLSGSGGGQALTFTRREVEILRYLHANHDRPVPRDELLTEVWGYRKNMDIETRTVDIHIAKLRRKIENDPKNPERLITVRGAGYRLAVE
jgi:two-component system response regulator RegX3